MLQMSDNERLAGMKAITQACILAGRPDLIECSLDTAWFDGRAAATSWLTQPVASAAAPAAASPAAKTTTAANSGSSFGPTPAERDALAVALQHRFEQVYPRRDQ